MKILRVLVLFFFALGCNLSDDPAIQGPPDAPEDSDCEPGQFVVSTGSDDQRVCAHCPNGTFSDAINAGECQLWSDCQPGEYVAAEPTRDADRNCMPCEGGFSTGTNQESCTAFSTCDVGQVPRDGSPTSDVSCSDCEEGTFSDPSEQSCQTFSDCPAGTYVASEGTASSDRSCVSCPGGQYTTEVNAAACEEFQECAPGTFVQDVGSRTGDRVCSPCPEGSFSDVVNVASCVPWSNCVNEVIEAEGTATTDRVCVPCPYGEEAPHDNATACSLIEFSEYVAGPSHLCGIRVDGTVVCWGNNLNGQASDYPVGVAVTAVSAGTRESCALREGDSELICWGRNSFSGINLNYPRITGARQVAHGTDSSCVIREDYRVTCWDSEASYANLPSQVEFSSIAGGGANTCGIRRDNQRAMCWGQNSFNVFDDVPTNIEFEAITGGANHFYCALRSSNSSPVCWGASSVVDSTPTTVAFDSIDASANVACGIRRSDRQIQCWGSSTDPVAAFPSGTFTSITLGSFYGCGVQTDGTRICWGNVPVGEPNKDAISSYNVGGSICLRRSTEDTTECYGNSFITDQSEPLTDLVVAGEFACGIRESDENARCWGRNLSGRASPPSGVFLQLAISNDHGCGIRPTNAIECWARNIDGQADGFDSALGYSQLSAGRFHTCALDTDGVVTCRGSNNDDQLNDLPPESDRFVQLDTGNSHSCALRADQTIRCWGSTLSGATDVPDGLLGVDIAAGFANSCAIRASDQHPVCWGRDDGSKVSNSPSVALESIKSDSSTITCGVRAFDGTLTCFGHRVWNPR